MLLCVWTSIFIFYSAGLTAAALAACLGCGDELMLSTSRWCFPGLECFLCLVVLERASEDVGPKAWLLSLMRRSCANHFRANLCFSLARCNLACTLASLLSLRTSLTKRWSLVSLSQSLTECCSISAQACVSSIARAFFLLANCSSTSWSWSDISENSLCSSIYLADSFRDSLDSPNTTLLSLDTSKLSCDRMTPPNEFSFGSRGMRWSVLALDYFSISLTDCCPEIRTDVRCSPIGLPVVDLIGDRDYCDNWNYEFWLALLPLLTIMLMTPLSTCRNDLYVLGDLGTWAIVSAETVCFTSCLIFFMTCVSYKAPRFSRNSLTLCCRTLGSGAGLLESCLYWLRTRVLGLSINTRFRYSINSFSLFFAASDIGACFGSDRLAILKACCTWLTLASTDLILSAAL